jgi:hypothetical protein
VPGDLSDAERCILYEGLTGESLVTVLNAWVRGDDAPYWNRKGAYVPDLIPAALSLLDRGMIEIWEEPAPFGEGSLMTLDRAAEALANPKSWWQYDPDGNWDPDEDLSRYAEVSKSSYEPVTAIYSIITTQSARDEGIAIW